MTTPLRTRSVAAHQPRIAVLSQWRNDADKGLAERAERLLSKTYPKLRFVWTVGDCDPGDQTREILARIAKGSGRRVTILDGTTGIHVEPGDSRARLVRLSRTASRSLGAIGPRDDYVLVHESDLQTPPDIAERLLATGKCPVAGWPTLTFPSGETIFYDTFAYRCACCGMMASSRPPYLHGYTADAPFMVASVGSVFLLDAADIRAGVRCEALGWVEVCRKLNVMGRRIWADPRIPVVQPHDYWSAWPHAPEPDWVKLLAARGDEGHTA